MRDGPLSFTAPIHHQDRAEPSLLCSEDESEDNSMLIQIGDTSADGTTACIEDSLSTQLAAMTSANRRFGLLVACLCLVWYVESSFSNILNKLLLQRFPFPLTVTMSSLFATAFYSAPLMGYCSIPVRTVKLPYLLKFLLPLAVGKVVAVAMAFTSISKVPVSYAHTGKST